MTRTANVWNDSMFAKITNIAPANFPIICYEMQWSMLLNFWVLKKSPDFLWIVIGHNFQSFKYFLMYLDNTFLIGV